MADLERRSLVTGVEDVERIAELFVGNKLFLRGLGAGVESETWPGREEDERLRDSPIRLIATMPAWEGSHRMRGHEQDLAYSIGAVVGAVAQRAEMDVQELHERLSTRQAQQA